MDVFDLAAVDTLVRTALAEDVGAGDLTTRLTVAKETRARAEITAKETAVVAGEECDEQEAEQGQVRRCGQLVVAQHLGKVAS